MSADNETSSLRQSGGGSGEDGQVVDRPPPATDKQEQTLERSGLPRPKEGGPVEGGEVSVADLRATVDPPQIADVHQKPREHLMLVLASLLCGMVALQFISLFVLAWNTDKKPESLEKAFNITLPVASGLVSSIVTFYFTTKKTS